MKIYINYELLCYKACHVRGVSMGHYTHVNNGNKSSLTPNGFRISKYSLPRL